MVNCGNLVKSALVALILAVASGHPGKITLHWKQVFLLFQFKVKTSLTRFCLFSDEKLASCCKKVNKLEITEPILGFLVQKANPPCVQAVM